MVRVNLCKCYGIMILQEIQMHACIDNGEATNIVVLTADLHDHAAKFIWSLTIYLIKLRVHPNTIATLQLPHQQSSVVFLSMTNHVIS